MVFFGVFFFIYGFYMFFCVVYLFLLGFFLFFYVYGVDVSVWVVVGGFCVLLDEMFGGFVGVFVGVWLGVVFIFLDWDRDW